MQVNYTLRESQILSLILEEKPNNHIAMELGLSVRTVETYKKNIQAKIRAKISE